MDNPKLSNAEVTFCRELSLVGTVLDLPRISDFVAEAALDARVDASLRDDLQLVIDEACCNVFEHAYAGEPGALQLRFEVHNGDVIITILDQGAAFDAEAINPVDISAPLAERPIGGLGLFIMGQLMDEVNYVFSADGNILTMIKRQGVPDEQF